MGSLIYYIPVLVFVSIPLLTRSLLDVRDPRLVRRPGGFWGPGRLFSDAEWTADGLLARRRYFRVVAVAFGAAGVAWVIVLGVASSR